MPPLEAVTLDFYLTLAHPRGAYRGARFHEYLARNGLTADPWEHQTLYDVFPLYRRRYRPDLTPDVKRAFWTAFTERLFARTGTRGAGADDFARHADAVGRMFGASCLALYDDVQKVLTGLRRRGLRLAIVSNWPPGLEIFCEELGLAPLVDEIVYSSEVGCAKPDPRIFRIAIERLRVRPEETFHVGDTYAEDIEGARAGLAAALIARADPPSGAADVKVFRNLTQVAQAIDAHSRAGGTFP